MTTIAQLKFSIQEAFLPKMVIVHIEDNTIDEPFANTLECSEIAIDTINLWIDEDE